MNVSGVKLNMLEYVSSKVSPYCTSFSVFYDFRFLGRLNG